MCVHVCACVYVCLCANVHMGRDHACLSSHSFGYPDMTYLSRLKEELASRGIVLQGEAL